LFSTDEGLTSPGQTISVKVFVVLTTGNERGSNTVTITRPVDREDRNDRRLL